MLRSAYTSSFFVMLTSHWTRYSCSTIANTQNVILDVQKVTPEFKDASFSSPLCVLIRNIETKVNSGTSCKFPRALHSWHERRIDDNWWQPKHHGISEITGSMATLIRCLGSRKLATWETTWADLPSEAKPVYHDSVHIAINVSGDYGLGKKKFV
jgi:hypothetical protein